METLTFDYSARYRPIIPGQPFHPVSLSEETKRAFESEQNKKYSKYISMINKVGGYIEVEISNTGDSILGGGLKATAEIHDLINDDRNFK